jgi:putative redox protein
MEMKVYFPGNKRVYADYKGFTIETDQPAHGGGDDTAPAPFDLFIASIGTCAGIFMLGFMQQRNIPTEGSGVTLRTEKDPETGLPCARRRIRKRGSSVGSPSTFTSPRSSPKSTRPR